MKNKTNKYFFLFIVLCFLFFAYKKTVEGYYGYDQQWNSPIRQWRPCDISFHSVEISPDKNKCCSNISVWDPTLSLCRPECTNGQIWNRIINKCVDPSTQCPTGYSMYKGNGKCGNPGFTNDVNSNF